MAHVVVFAGEYDLANQHGIRRALRSLESCEDLVLDLSDVTYIDSTFIAELIILEKARRVNSLSRLTIVSPADSVIRRIFDVCGIIATLDVVASYAGRHDGSSDSITEFAAAGDVVNPTTATKSPDFLD